MKCNANSQPTSVPPDGKPQEEQPAWRKDFPIETEQDNYIARRDFTKFMVLTSLAFTVGQFWIGGQSILRQQAAKLSSKRIASLASLPVGGALTFDYPAEHDSCIMVRRGEQELVAYSQKCTHLSCAVVPEVAEGRFHCPCHNGMFDMSTGRPLQGPPKRPLPRIRLEVRGDDIYAVGVEVSTV